MNLQTLEQNARRAKEMNSFRDYKAGTATAEYMEYCQRAEEVAEATRAKLEKAQAPADRTEKVDYLLKRYKAKKLEWLTEVYQNRASVPSVMIAGPANFPTRKKERQLSREKSLYESDPEYIIEKIESIGRDARTIRSDDKNAVDRIKIKIESLQGMPDPYGNKAAEIRRLKERLFVLAPEEFKKEQENITVNGAKTYNEILALWENGKISKSMYDPESDRYYFDLPLLFDNGKRKYKQWLNFEIDKDGKYRLAYNLEKRETEAIPLTDEYKYRLMIAEISGSGNKNIMYQYLKNLSPATQEKKAEAERIAESGEVRTVTINGEVAEVVANAEDMRLRLIFDGKPETETRNILKSNGFKWSPKNTAWQRLLNNNAKSALNRIIDK